MTRRLKLVTDTDINTTNPRAINAAHWRTTDIANAAEFIDAHGKDLRYAGTWHGWDSKRFKRDGTNATLALAQTTVATWWKDVGTAGSPEEREILAGHFLKSARRPRIADMLALAASDRRVAMLPDAFDRDPWLLNTDTATVDLRTGDAHGHRREDLISKLTPVAYDPDARCPRFLEFLYLIFDGNEALVGFVQRLAGYSATGSTREQCLPFGWGGGANGKSTMIECLHMALGEYAHTAPPSLLMASKHESHPTEIADLMGARLVSTIETEQDRRLAEVKVKWLTGEKVLKARFMRQDFFEFVPTHTFWLLGNHKPVVTGQDHAIWRRLYLIPFTVNLSEKLGPDNLVRDFSATLVDELPGILAWIVEGAIAWHAEGLRPPDIVRAATNDYRLEMDAVAHWIGESCESGAFRTPFKALYAAYAADAGSEALSKRSFAQELDRLGIHDREIGGVHFRSGVRLRGEIHD